MIQLPPRSEMAREFGPGAKAPCGMGKTSEAGSAQAEGFSHAAPLPVGASFVATSLPLTAIATWDR